MRKRILALLLALAAALTCFLTACDGKNQTSSAAEPHSSSSPSSANESSSAGTTANANAAAGQKTAVGTPRDETLIVECRTPNEAVGQFNPYMNGTPMEFGVHQLTSCHLWEFDPVSNEQFPEVAADMGTPNPGFTEWTVRLRQGITWSDGEELTADDVVFTFNMLLTNADIKGSSALSLRMASCEKLDEYTVLFKMKEPSPRFPQDYGVTAWGSSFRLVPAHIYSRQTEITVFKDEQPVVAGPYIVEDYDLDGSWILYKLRDDWQHSTLGLVGPERYGYTAADKPAEYVWFRYLGDSASRQEAIIDNEVDLLCGVTPEEFQLMSSRNSNIRCWFEDFPHASFDYPGAKGVVFSNGQGEPWNNPDLHWGICLALDIDELAMSVYSGAGRAAPIPLLSNTEALQSAYVIPMQDWLENFELELGDGSVFKPYDAGYAARMASRLGVTGTDRELTALFGAGWWKHDEDAAEKLLQKAGLDKREDGWYYGARKFTIELSYLGDSDPQSARIVHAVYDQLTAFGLNCAIVSKSSAIWNADASTGNYQLAGYSLPGGCMQDLYNDISGCDNTLITPLGEASAGLGFRWNNQRATDILAELAGEAPDDENARGLYMEFLQESVRDMPCINFLSSVSYTPTNCTYWENYPCGENPYDCPWWWWSRFKYTLPMITPVKEE